MAALFTHGCQKCTRFLRLPDSYQSEDPFERPVYTRFNANCQFCCQVLEPLAARIPDSTQYVVDVLPTSSGGLRCIFIRKLGSPGDELEYILYTVDRECKPFDHLPVYPTRLDLGAALPFIQENLKECLENHDGFCGGLEPRRLPKRVIDVEPANPSVRLVETASGRLGIYATLSHCWGTTQPLQTTKATLAEMLKCIPEKRLPIVFAQAISIVRRLEIRYLWIDSLCIIQGDQTDWETESANMHEYYSNAFLNISAASSTDHSTPFLTDRDPIWHPFEVCTTSQQRLYGRRIPETIISSDQGGKLFTRAWAYQEAALSPRSVHFANDDLVWECRHHVKGQHAEPRGLMMSGAVGNAAKLPRLSAIHDDIDHTWHEIVQGYSRRDLTFPLDRLPALAGVAALYSRAAQKRYLAGLWDGASLPRHLSWEANYHPQPQLDRESLLQPSVYIAPSWSWASIMGPVQWAWPRSSSDKFKSCATILEATCDLSGLMTYGRVSGGRLSLRAPAICRQLSCPEPQGLPEDLDFYTIEGFLNFLPDCLLETNGESMQRVVSAASLNNPQYKSHGGKVWCVQLGYHPETGLGEESVEDALWSRALVLGKTGDVYVRLGLIPEFSAEPNPFLDAPVMEFTII